MIRTYAVENKMPETHMEVVFQRPWWRILLAPIILSQPETFRAEVRYLYDGGDTWPERAKWWDVDSYEITVITNRNATLEVMRSTAEGFTTLEGKQLPDKFTLEID